MSSFDASFSSSDIVVKDVPVSGEVRIVLSCLEADSWEVMYAGRGTVNIVLLNLVRCEGDAGYVTGVGGPTFRMSVKSD